MDDILIEKMLKEKSIDNNNPNLILVWVNIILHVIVIICTVYSISDLNK